MADGKLTALKVKALLKEGAHQPGRHTDGGGMHLHIREDGRGAWVLRFRLHDRQRDLTLGSPLGDEGARVTLQEARNAAATARAHIRAGRDPIRERQREAQEATEAGSRDRSFLAAMESTLASRDGVWRNEKHRWQWRQTLEKRAIPVLGKLPVSEVAVDDVLRVLRPIWAKTPETATRLRGRMEAVLDHARALGWRTGENPARWKGNLSELLPNPSKLARVERQPALPWSKVPAFVAALRERRGMAALALEFCILTAARSGEVRGVTWSEIDAEAAIWTVQATRMKAGEMHRVPLSDAAMAVLLKLRPDKPRADGLIFPSSRNTPLSDMALTMLVRGMALDDLEEGELPRWRDLTGRAVVPHGFRSSFRDWCGETRPEGREVAERALAHVVRGVEAAYARSDLLERRRPMMQAWGEFCVSVQPAGHQAGKLFLNQDAIA